MGTLLPDTLINIASPRPFTRPPRFTTVTTLAYVYVRFTTRHVIY